MSHSRPKKGNIMFITRQNLKGGKQLTGFPISEDPDSGYIGYKIGYCKGCNHPLLIRSIELRETVQAFSHTLYRQPMSRVMSKIRGLFF